LRALAAEGVLEEDTEQRFRNTPLSELLRPEVPGSLRELTLLFGDATSWRSWEAILHSVRTGAGAFEHVFGERFFDHAARRPELAALFDTAMASASATTHAAVVAAYDFSALRSAVDVAGGIGAALCTILHAAPALTGIVFDLPHLADRARAFIAEQKLSDRCSFVAGDFFASMPGGADLYFMKHILHDWGDEDCVRILRVCRSAMHPGARLLVCERVVPPGNAPSSAKLFDLHMLLTMHGGRERTLGEYRELLVRAGFDLSRLIPTSTAWSLVEAIPV
jgi:hypothetical protein